MGLLGGGGGGTTKGKVTRPDYINALVDQIAAREQAIKTGDFTALQRQGLNNDYIQKLMNSEELNSTADQLISMGSQGLEGLNQYYNMIADVYNKSPTAEDINSLASQLYNRNDVQNEINAQNALLAEDWSQRTAPSIAEQQSQSGFGSGQRTMKDMSMRDLARAQQQSATAISTGAQQNATALAQDLISGQQANRRAALSAFGNNINAQVGALNTGLNFQQQAQQQALQAAQLQQGENQAQLDTNYQNQQLAQNWDNLDIQQRLGIASVLNAAKGQQVTKTTSGGGGGLGSMMGLIGTVAGGVAGSMIPGAGTVVGAQLGGMAGGMLGTAMQ